jgi:hypothetical protein
MEEEAVEEIVRGDFVQMNRQGATTVGLVHKVEFGRAYVWWRTRDKADGQPEIVPEMRPTSELRIVKESSPIPNSMILLRQERIGDTAFRVRRD